MNRLVSFLKEEEVEFETEKKLSHIASIGIGGAAALFVTPKNKEKFLTKHAIKSVVKLICIKHKEKRGNGNYGGKYRLFLRVENFG